MRIVTLTPSDHELPRNLAKPEWAEIVDGVAAAWNEGMPACGVPRIQVAPMTHRWLAEEDGTNLVVFRSREWCHNERCSRTDTYPMRALAMTTTYPAGATGALVGEADIELGLAAFVALGRHQSKQGIGGAVAGASLNAQDLPSAHGLAPADLLQRVLLHEVGHVLGLPDVCANQPVQSAEVQSCPVDYRERAMYALGLNATPSRGDYESLCHLYASNGAASSTTSAGLQSLLAMAPEYLWVAGVLAAVASAWVLLRHLRSSRKA